MRVKKGNVEFKPTPDFICHKLVNRPRMTKEMCQARGDNPNVFPDRCASCPNSVKPIIRIAIRRKYETGT